MKEVPEHPPWKVVYSETMVSNHAYRNREHTLRATYFYLTAANTFVPCVMKATWFSVITANGWSAMTMEKVKHSPSRAINAIIPGVEKYTGCFPILWCPSNITPKM